MRDDLVACADGRSCPVGSACDDVHAGCVDPAQLDACRDLEPFAACDAITNGRCFDGVCLPAGCGNALPEPEELCDDGNTASFDGCSADCLSRERCGDGFVDAQRGEQCDDGNARNRDGCTARCEFEDFEWRIPGALPLPRRSASLVYDAARERVVLFGGRDELGFPLGDTWEWNGKVWTLATPAIAPFARAGSAMAYDPMRRRIVMFGGRTTAGMQNDTWEWDGARWHQMRPTLTPVSRHAHAMGWDPVRRRVILHGGDVNFTQLDDTWEWNGIDWVFVGTGDTGPKWGHALVTDAASGQLLMVGGRTDHGAAGVRHSETWRLAATGWVLHTGAGAWPGADVTAAAYDLARRVTVVRGTSSAVARTWELSGTAWTERTPATSPQLPLHDLAAVYDTARAEVITFGGASTEINGSVRDVFAWTGTAWALQVPAPRPPARALAAMAYDPVRRRTVLFGGVDPAPMATVLFDDTWEWDGEAWTQIAPATVRPTPRFDAAMAYDRTSGEVIVHGGRVVAPLDETWSWDGRRWQLRAVGADTPGKRGGAAMAFDPRRNRVVLFGGLDTNNVPLGDTWEWNGAAWAQIPTPIAPPARTTHAMTYDPARERIVLQGGSVANVAFQDVWEWDGVTWTDRSTPSVPQFRSGHAIVYDEVRRTLLNFGGIPDFSTWESNAGTWRQLSSTLEPALVLGLNAAYDPMHAESVMFGGANGIFDIAFDTTWVGCFRGPTEELCRSGHDHDGDGAIGCADVDCAALCGGCGNGVCDVIEDDRLCAADCLPGAALCGDYYCAPQESCAVDCP